MNTRYLWRPATWLPLGVAVVLTASAAAQSVSAPAPSTVKEEDATKLEKFVVTGSLLKRLETEGALPVTVLNPIELEMRGVVSVEEMLMDLNINGNGLDNLASNADVVAGQQRGN